MSLVRSLVCISGKDFRLPSLQKAEQNLTKTFLKRFFSFFELSVLIKSRFLEALMSPQI